MKLTNNERGLYTDYFRFSADDLRAIGNGGTRKIATIPAGGAMSIVSVTPIAAITGTTSLVFNIGVSGATGAFISAMDVDAATVGLPVSNTGTDFTQAAGTTTFLGGIRPVRNVSVDTDVILTITDANIANITGGDVIIGLGVMDLSRVA